MDKETIMYLIAIIGCLIGVYGFYRTQRQDATNDAKEFIKVNLKLDQLCNTTNESSKKLDALDNKIDDIKEKQQEHEFRIRQLEMFVENQKK